jgi:hypothetical protein
MTKPNGRAGHHISYAQINPFPFKFYGPPHVLPKSQKKHWARTSTALGEDLDGGGGARGGVGAWVAWTSTAGAWWRRTLSHPVFKPKPNAHSMCAQESSLHTYRTENGYRITNVSL